MRLRPRQIEFRDRCLAAIREHGNTMGIAPTGAGKTVMLSAVAGELPGPVLVIQHRDELVSQNRRTFFAVNPKIPTDVFTADRKRWARDGATFGMIQTLVRNLEDFVPFGTVIVDECHHAAASSYLKTFARARELRPDVRFFGVTATPGRGDKKALRGIFDNVGDQITLKELIEHGHLVRPRTFVVDIGTQDELRNVKRNATDFDMAEVEAIMDKEVLNDRVVEEWRKLAGERRTVVFAATVAHAAHVVGAFVGAGVSARVVHGGLADAERRGVLAAFDRGEFQVLVNVAVLTEGWDCPPVACVVLLRPSSYKSTMIQMIGRGLRTVDPERYPGIVKHDCVVIDFGTSILTHGSLEQEANLDGKGGVKTCPECAAKLPAGCRECPLCGHEFPSENEAPKRTCPECAAENPASAKVCQSCGAAFPEKERGGLADFVLTEIDLFDASPYRWESLFEGGLVLVAASFEAWAMAVWYGGQWHAFGGSKLTGVKHLAAHAERLIPLAAADDFLRAHGDADAKKTKRWLNEAPSAKQLMILGMQMQEAVMAGVTKYRAACLMTWKWNEAAIRGRLTGQVRPTPPLAA